MWTVFTNATNATLHPLGQAIWGHIWKRTVEISQKNATSVILHPLKQVVWELIWWYTIEKSLKNQPVWICMLSGKQFEYTFENTLRRKQTNATSVTMHAMIHPIWGNIWKPRLRKVKKVESVWLCILSNIFKVLCCHHTPFPYLSVFIFKLPASEKT